MASGPSSDEPIRDQERMLRRIPLTYWSPDDQPVPPVHAFLPRKPNKQNPEDQGDIDGLSVSRESITSAVRLSHSNQRRYHVAGVKAGYIRSQQVSIVPDPQPTDSGHCLLPEFSTQRYLGSPEGKRWIKERARALASKSVLVFRMT